MNKFGSREKIDKHIERTSNTIISNILDNLAYIVFNFKESVQIFCR